MSSENPDKHPPKWRKSPPELVAFFDAAIGDNPPVELKKMFGYPAAFLNTHLYAGLHQENMILRLPEADRKELIEKHGASVFAPMDGRVMKEYVSLPPAMLVDPAALAPWVSKAMGFVANMPPKKPKTKKPNGKTKTKTKVAGK